MRQNSTHEKTDKVMPKSGNRKYKISKFFSRSSAVVRIAFKNPEHEGQISICMLAKQQF